MVPTPNHSTLFTRQTFSLPAPQTIFSVHMRRVFGDDRANAIGDLVEVMSGQIEEVNEKRGGNDTVATDEGIASGDTSAQTKTKPGASWKANEQHVLPKNNMPLVFAGLMLCVFLAALDQVSILRSSLLT